MGVNPSRRCSLAIAIPQGAQAQTSSAAACAENLVGDVEYALCGTLGDGLALAPRLDVASTELRAWQAKRLTAKQGHGLGFDLANVARRGVRIGQVTVTCVP